MPANRGTSSKSPRFFCHWQRFCDFPDAPESLRHASLCSVGADAHIGPPWKICIKKAKPGQALSLSGFLYEKGKSYVEGKYRSGEKELIVICLRTAGLAKQGQQVGNGELFLFFAGDIQHHMARIHHNEAVAVGDGIAHIVGDHHGG